VFRVKGFGMKYDIPQVLSFSVSLSLSLSLCLFLCLGLCLILCLCLFLSLSVCRFLSLCFSLSLSLFLSPSLSPPYFCLKLFLFPFPLGSSLSVISLYLQVNDVIKYTSSLPFRVEEDCVILSCFVRRHTPTHTHTHTPTQT
jgi:hypothetical protein